MAYNVGLPLLRGSMGTVLCFIYMARVMVVIAGYYEVIGAVNEKCKTAMREEERFTHGVLLV